MSTNFKPSLVVVGLFLAATSFANPVNPVVNQPAPGPAAQKTGLAVESARITDEKIYADRQTLDALQLRLRKLNESGIGQNYYPLAKSQCWLDTAKTQYHENDRTGYIEESLVESSKIIRALEADAKSNAGSQTPLVAKSTFLRQDLWDRLNAFKANPDTLVCNAKTVACAEVRLVRAGHAEQQTGWRQATPHVQMVEDAVRRAELEAKACQVAAVAPKAAPVVAAAPQVAVPVAPPPPPVPVAPPQIIERESFVLLSDALFIFDKGAEDKMLSGGKTRIAEIAEKLKSYKSIQTISIVGHTDRLGSDAHNDPLSAQRAKTVQAALERMGVIAGKIDVSGRGKRDPVTASLCPTSMARAAAIVCLQPDRRVSIEARGIVK